MCSQGDGGGGAVLRAARERLGDDDIFGPGDTKTPLLSLDPFASWAAEMDASDASGGGARGGKHPGRAQAEETEAVDVTAVDDVWSLGPKGRARLLAEWKRALCADQISELGDACARRDRLLALHSRVSPTLARLHTGPIHLRPGAPNLASPPIASRTASS